MLFQLIYHHMISTGFPHYRRISDIPKPVLNPYERIRIHLVSECLYHWLEARMQSQWQEHLSRYIQGSLEVFHTSHNLLPVQFLFVVLFHHHRFHLLSQTPAHQSHYSQLSAFHWLCYPVAVSPRMIPDEPIYLVWLY